MLPCKEKEEGRERGGRGGREEGEVREEGRERGGGSERGGGGEREEGGVREEEEKNGRPCFHCHDDDLQPPN